MHIRRLIPYLPAAALAAGLAVPAAAQSLQVPRGGLLIHGNYCGPGNRAPLPPVDALDAACARHDACTPRGRPATAECNARLYREANAIAHDPHQPADIQAAAGFVAFGASLLPSAPASRPAVAVAPYAYGYAPARVTPWSPPPLDEESFEDEE